MDTTCPLYLPDGTQTPNSGEVGASGPGAGGQASADIDVGSPEGTGPPAAVVVTPGGIVNQGDHGKISFCFEGHV